jgi:Uncharacterized low-complexity proteins
MAHNIDLRKLKQGPNAWNAWRHRQQPFLNNANIRKQRALYAELLPSLRPYITIPRNAIDLTNVDLNSMNLKGADLSNVDLSGSDLSRSSLTEADFTNSSLCGAALTKCDLTFADLTGVDLTDADLQGADLTAATLRAATLSGANFNASSFRQTVLANVDLSEARGLEEVCHKGPSIVGVDVIYRSGGQISAAFLRGAGVPDSLIENAKALVAATAPIEFYSCFISYSHANKIFARRLCRELEDRSIRCWLDEHQLLPGDDMYHAVDQGIRLWDKLLLCCSVESLKSWWVDHEIGTALEKEQQLSKQVGSKVHVLIPLNLDGYLFTNVWTSGYQSQIRRRLAADFSDLSKFDEQLASLIRALRSDEQARPAPPAPKLKARSFNQ